MQIRRIQGKRTNLSKDEKVYLKISKDIFKNKIKDIKTNVDLLKNAIVNVEKKKEIIGKWIKENSKNAQSFTK